MQVIEGAFWKPFAKSAAQYSVNLARSTSELNHGFPRACNAQAQCQTGSVYPVSADCGSKFLSPGSQTCIPKQVYFFPHLSSDFLPDHLLFVGSSAPAQLGTILARGLCFVAWLIWTHQCPSSASTNMYLETLEESNWKGKVQSLRI